MKIIILFSVLIHSIIASPFLVKDHHSIVLEKGKTFFINNDDKKYKFVSINFELELINNSIDLKHIKSITFYDGNQALKLAKGGLFCGLFYGFGASIANPNEVIRNMALLSIPLGAIGFSIGYFIPKKKNYIISDSKWRFVP